jgi:DUF917 family protein
MKNEIFKEIKRNKNYIRIITQVLIDNKIFFKGDVVKAFEHSKGFLMKSIKDMEDANYIEHRHRFKNDDEYLALESAYKAFAVVADVLSFLDKVNSETETKTFLLNFNTASNTAIKMANKALELEDVKK